MAAKKTKTGRCGMCHADVELVSGNWRHRSDRTQWCGRGRQKVHAKKALNGSFLPPLGRTEARPTGWWPL